MTAQAVAKSDSKRLMGSSKFCIRLAKSGAADPKVDTYDKPVSELTESKKQIVSALAGGLIGDNDAAAMVGVQVGKTTAENNYLSNDFICKSGDSLCNQKKALFNKLLKNGTPYISEILEAIKECPGGTSSCDFSADKYNQGKEKFISVVDNWSSSIRNPNSPGGSKPWAIAEQQKMIDQAKKYSVGFDCGARYHTNSLELASHYMKCSMTQGQKF